MLFFDPRNLTRPNTLDFKPPLPNPLVQKIFHWILPGICEGVLGGLTVEVSAQSMERLRNIRGERCLILPNHPSEWDPCVIFDLGRQMNENFFFVAAREVFDYSLGLRGWFFQRLGVYSLVRGSNDRKSLKTSMEILSKNKGRLVIFVEGEISNQNETLLPLESGVIQLAFMALNDMYKEKGKDLAALPSLYVCPVGLRYIYDVRGLDKAIDKSIHRLEEALGLLNSGKTVWFERVRTIAGVVMREASAQIGYPLDESLPLADNVRNVSGFMLTKLEQIINLPPDAALSPLDRIRRIRNLLDQVLNQEAEAEPTDYQKRLNDHRKDVLQNLYQDLDRVVNFIAVYDGYLQPDMADFRYVELLRRMEREVFGQFHLVHPRKGHVEVMEPIDLRDHFADFLQDKKAVVERIAADVERKIYAGVEAGGL